MTDLAWIFPGQGAQYIGMGKALAEAFPSARVVFEEVNTALDQPLSRLMWAGDDAELKLTTNTQPALMACGVAAMRALETEFGIDASLGKYAAGHSLGEYTALTAMGALGLTDSARLLRIRGNAMQAAVPIGKGGMVALLGASVEQAQALCNEQSGKGILSIANDNAKGQIVLSGELTAIEAACETAKSHGIKKAVKLDVSAPFHCALMQPAADKMAKALANVDVQVPKVPVISNVTLKAETSADAIRQNLVDQVTGHVRWRETMMFMQDAGIGQTAELGCGKVLSVMNRRTVSDIEGLSLDTPESLEAFAKSVLS